MKSLRNHSPHSHSALRPSLASIFAITALFAYSLQAQIILDPAWRVTPDTNSVGFKWAYFQAGRDTGNSVARAESDLALGSTSTNIGDPNILGGTVSAAIAPSPAANPFNGLLYFDVTNVINFSKSDGGGSGNFIDDILAPGCNLTSSTDGQAAEILTFITLPVGTNYMGFNSDDGFATYAGPNPGDAFGRTLTLGQYNGGRGASDTIYSFVVQQAGTYPFRTIWENGGGDSNLEWFTSDDEFGSNRKLINDVANGGVPAYRVTTGISRPYIKSVSPPSAIAQTESVKNNVSVLLADGSTAVDTNSISLTVDGQPMTLTITRSGSFVSVATAPFTGLRLASERHTAVLVFKDVGGAYTRTQQWTFAGIENLVLPPSPITGENFDAYPEAPDAAHAAPPGWILTNYSWLELGATGFDVNGGDVWDLTSQANDPYANWCMVSTNTSYALEDETMDNRQDQLVNGVPLRGPTWMNGNVLFCASDGRARRCVDGTGSSMPNQYAPQIQFAVSAPFDLSSVTNPVLTFSSGVRISGNGEMYALEYSADDGTNWLPGIIMFNANRLFYNPDGTYDAVKCMTNVWADVATFPVVQDPTTRLFVSVGTLGGRFGDVLKSPITPAMSSTIANRNDGSPARKVEAIRLPEAARKKAVRLRFVHHGSCGWEWAVDNIAFYDVAPPGGGQTTNPPHIDSIQAANGSVTIKWSNGGTLLSAPTVNGAWTSTGNSSGSFTEAITGGAKFYRVQQ